MKATPKSVGRFRTMLAWGLVLLLLAEASGVGAQEDCEVLSKLGEPRSCTITEELASCILDSSDSHEQCHDNADGFWETLGCEVTHMADDAACVVAAPVTWGFGKLF
jgi:hypothetical protein